MRIELNQRDLEELKSHAESREKWLDLARDENPNYPLLLPLSIKCADGDNKVWASNKIFILPT